MDHSRIRSCLIVLGIAATYASLHVSAPRANEQLYATNQVIVEFADGVVGLPADTEGPLLPLREVPFTIEGLATDLETLGIESVGILAKHWRYVDPTPGPFESHVPPLLGSFRNTYLLRFPPTRALDGVVEGLRQLPGIRLVARDPLLSLPTPYWPSDTLLTCPGDTCGRAYQWNFENTGGEIFGVTCTEGIDVGMRDAWAIQKECTIRIGLVDSGVDSDHPDLDGNIDTSRGRNYQSSTCDSLDWEDYTGHGTMTAGIFGALHSSSGLGVAGICGYQSPSSRHSVIVPIKIWPPDPYTGDGTAAALINALSYLSRIYPDVPLAALEVYIQDDGPGAISKPYIQLLSKACWNAHCTGILLTTAAGNQPIEDAHASYPAAFDDLTLAVAALGCDGTREQGFWGGTDAQSAPWIDLSAPGSADSPETDTGIRQIVTTQVGGGYALGSDLFQGTSAALPHAAGVAGLLASHTTSMTNEDQMHLLINTAMSMDALGNGGDYGSGLLRADSALTLVDSLLLVHDMCAGIDSYTLVDSCVTRKFRNIRLAAASIHSPDFEGTTYIQARVKIYEFAADVSLSANANSSHTPPTWVRGRQSLSAKYLETSSDRYDGYTDSYYGEVSSVTSESATLTGWTYQLWSPNGGCAGAAGDTLWGWFPLRLPLQGSPTVFSFSYLADTTGTPRFQPRDRSSGVSKTIHVTGTGPQVRIELGRAFASPVTLQLFDITGRRVQTLGGEEDGGLSGSFVWDGRDLLGRPASSGVYYGKLEGGSDEYDVRILLLR